jgi:hypothetical protein
LTRKRIFIESPVDVRIIHPVNPVNLEILSNAFHELFLLLREFDEAATSKSPQTTDQARES